jgi:hypothetical protein
MKNHIKQNPIYSLNLGHNPIYQKKFTLIYIYYGL